MAKDDTIENRVYLFESLASSYISAASELLPPDVDPDDKGAKGKKRK